MVNDDGLVGRVLRVTRTTATVLLVVDADSVVGGRVGDSMEVGFLHGRGVVGRAGRLDLELVDDATVPARDDTVVTWGSDGGAPYVSGVPVGRVTKVYDSLRETAHRAVIEPVRRLQLARPGRRRGRSGHGQRPGPGRGRREPAVSAPARAVLAGLLVLLGVVLQTSVLPLLAWRRPCPTCACSSWWPSACRLARRPARWPASPPGSPSTWPRRPTTSPAAGRWRWRRRLRRRPSGHPDPGADAGARGRALVASPARALPRVAAVTAAASFVATSVFALTGLVFGELAWSVPELLRGVLVALLFDVAAGVLVLPPMLRALGAVETPGPAPALDGSR